MKRLLCFLLSILCIESVSYGQFPNTKRFDFLYLSEQGYEQLSNTATQVNLPIDWDEEISEPITLSFPFYYQGVLIQTVSVDPYGDLLLNGIMDDYIASGHIFGVNVDYAAVGRGRVFYETVGIEPNRVLKVEFRDVGRANDPTGNDTVNYQIWLLESSNSIEFRIGYNNVADENIAQLATEFPPKDVVFIGLLTNDGNTLATNTDALSLQFVDSNNVDSIIPLIDIITDPTAATYIAASYKRFPNDGDVFRFVPKLETTIISPENAQIFTVRPNPFSSQIDIDIPMKIKVNQINITNSLGQQYVLPISFGDTVISIKTEALPDGCYFIEILGTSGREILKVLKQKEK